MLNMSLIAGSCYISETFKVLHTLFNRVEKFDWIFSSDFFSWLIKIPLGVSIPGDKWVFISRIAMVIQAFISGLIILNYKKGSPLLFIQNFLIKSDRFNTVNPFLTKFHEKIERKVALSLCFLLQEIEITIFPSLGCVSNCQNYLVIEFNYCNAYLYQNLSIRRSVI